MKKFLALVKKEVREVLTLQTLAPLLIVIVAFNVVGKLISKEAIKVEAPQEIAVLDLDQSDFSRGVTEALKAANLRAEVSLAGEKQGLIAQAREQKKKAVVVIPAGFGKGLEKFESQQIELYAIMTGFSPLGARSAEAVRAGIARANEQLSNQLITRTNTRQDPAVLKNPLRADDFVVVGGRQARISASAVAGFISSQTTFIPIILFLAIVLAAQMIAVSIAAEKENKTLETLLSSPVSRRAIVAAKLFAAGLVSLLTAIVYLFGMRSYMTSMTGGALPSGSADQIEGAIAQLGLTFSTGDYLLLGLSLFFGILAALAVAFILGSFAQDTKSAQGMIAPLMILILVPYLLTLLFDFSSLSFGMKIFVYAIPFSHSFMAAPNLLLGQTQNVWYGIAYLAFFFAAAVVIAARIFSSERIFTWRLNLRRNAK